MYTSKQKAIIATPLILALLFSFVVFVSTLFTSKELAYSAQELVQTRVIQFFFMTLFNLIPAAIFSFLLGLYVFNYPGANGSLSFLLACGLIGGFFPVFWFYALYYFNPNTLYPVAIALYGLPSAYLIGMLVGWTIGRLILAQFPNLFNDKEL